MSDPFPDIDAFEGRTAIMEFDAGYSREVAEDMAARAQGFRDAAHLLTVLRDYLKNQNSK